MSINPNVIDELLKQYKTPEEILGKDGLLKQLTKAVLERALDAELGHHLKRERLDAAEAAEGPPAASRNVRNGRSRKTVQTDHGELALDVPRDRQATFEPVIVPKHARRLAGLDEKIIGLYATGMSDREISRQLEDMYGVDISASLISDVTDAVMDEVTTWQSRPLDAIYPIVYLDRSSRR